MDKKVIIGLLIALLSIILVGFVALHFVPTNGIANDVQGNATENTSLNVSQSTVETQINNTINETVSNVTALNETLANVTANATADMNGSNPAVADTGDVLHKQSIIITGNQTGQYQGMEPGTYIIYYTENDGVIKIEKIA